MKKTVYVVTDNETGKVVYVSLNRDKAFNFAEVNKCTITAYKEQTVYGLKD
ncbi:hypothetical protein JOC94_002361 [Bacillus thermophilus]|uniref:Phage protein n=1 Tax=Siminovitchia thermophila TaxID=1245522 RepID=A0ABS2R8A9_9BACI|nr:hypothetical protein [Siminovitchia thermophila]MBM7715374.1 hypothetical protein [Siminovitchia thermophila]